jgi:hypothetical protein
MAQRGGEKPPDFSRKIPRKRTLPHENSFYWWVEKEEESFSKCWGFFRGGLGYVPETSAGIRVVS